MNRYSNQLQSSSRELDERRQLAEEWGKTKHAKEKKPNLLTLESLSFSFSESDKAIFTYFMSLRHSREGVICVMSYFDVVMAEAWPRHLISRWGVALFSSKV